MLPRTVSSLLSGGETEGERDKEREGEREMIIFGIEKHQSSPTKLITAIRTISPSLSLTLTLTRVNVSVHVCGRVLLSFLL